MLEIQIEKKKKIESALNLKYLVCFKVECNSQQVKIAGLEGEFGFDFLIMVLISYNRRNNN